MHKHLIQHIYHLNRTNVNIDLNAHIQWLNDPVRRKVQTYLINWLYKMIMCCLLKEPHRFSFLLKIIQYRKGKNIWAELEK